MSRLKQGEVVWALTSTNKQQWPAVVSTDSSAFDDEVKIQFYTGFSVRKKGVSICRSKVRPFDAVLAKDFRPKKPKHARNMTREMGNFDRAVEQASKGLVEAREKAKLEYEKKLQEALRGPENPNTEHLDQERPRLEAGCKVFYWQPGRIMGNPDAMCYSKVLEVYSQERISRTQCPIRLETGHVLSMGHEVQILDDSKSTGMFRLSEYELVSSMAEGKGVGERIHEMLDAQAKQLQEQNPKFASLIGNQLRSGNHSNPAQEPRSKQPVALSSKKGAKRCFESLLSDSDSDSERHFAPRTIKRKAKKPLQGKKLLNGKNTLPAPRHEESSESSEDLPELGSQSSRPTSIRATPALKPRAKAEAKKTIAKKATVKAKHKTTTKLKAKPMRKTVAIDAGVKARTKTEGKKTVSKDTTEGKKTVTKDTAEAKKMVPKHTAREHSSVQMSSIQRLKLAPPMKIPKKGAAIQKQSSTARNGYLSTDDEDED